MPNYCNNKVEISGPPVAIDTLLERMKQPYRATALVKTKDKDGNRTLTHGPVTVRGKFLLWNIVRPPDELLDEYHAVSDSTATQNNWYYWNSENWGTKWEIFPKRIRRRRGSLTVDVLTEADEWIEVVHDVISFTFESAWSPPLAAFHALAAQCPELSISLAYDEPGVDLYGLVTWKNGEPVRGKHNLKRANI